MPPVTSASFVGRVRRLAQNVRKVLAVQVAWRQEKRILRLFGMIGGEPRPKISRLVGVGTHVAGGSPAADDDD